ncbi:MULTISPECIES: NACHT domain-containing protein [unclassified Microcystis]|uniref:NACHT domain-containing protein n=1 Tax=Microcystis flos-aquae Mf_QC_C_20070823_S10D TaxID=2486236 RepID=A0A552KP05_9CHRO|nr:MULTISPECIES: NACHT domain-containing protein [unclassified Microcystis]MCA2819419.1 NACHT domain-containing protein [Microcystis sp. M085S1]MCA2857526.1 NACHT domain-containing protein [Microcystis sp. M065S1]TRT78107.1 MAG: NACHT domain-containing protein [Microcystis flos-aquae Ma_QC_C_20070823_S18]TRT98091.1 MAG: NACHT domain-containing protein [Microcystis flos-aquae Ma_QC_C_20070823_S18D]TRV09692.1 MAG: NACHT domain-containing protein [Microcystis flos-aquae Mf_QC_C_20070823_S10D]TRV
MTGIETTILTALTNNVIGQTIKSWWECINKNELLNKDVGQLIREVKYLFWQEYTQRYRDRHGMIKVLKMSKPMDLESIYVNVKCLGNLVRDYYDENLENKYRESKQRRFNFRDDGKKDGLLLANQEQYLMVLGDPGIGKSTFLRKVGLEALKGKQGSYQHPLKPVLLELKNFKENEINIQVLIEEEFKICGFPNVEKSISNKLEKGELLILLDGLDEVPTANVNNVIEKIKDFVDRHHKNRFILSCRTAARTHLRQFTDIEIVEFDDQQIQSFIEHWFSSELDRKNETAKNCWELLQKEEYKSAKELAHTPLLLTFLCLVYDDKQSFPTNRSCLYQNALRILLETWSAEKRLPNRGLVYENLSIEQEEILLSEVAYQNFVADKLFLKKREIVKQIKDHLKQNLNAPQHLDGEKVLKTIEIEQGILVERARDVYSFSHLTLQEYLTAQYIYDNDLIEETVKNYVTETRWQEVFLLVAGLMRGKADKLLLAMEKEAHNYLKTPLGQKLVPILQWADEMTKDSVDSPIKPVGRRASAYCHAHAYAYAIVSANDPLIHDLGAVNLTSTCAYVGLGSYDTAYVIARAYGNAYGNAYRELFAISIYGSVRLVNLLAQDRIISKVNFSQLIADLEALKQIIPDDKITKKHHEELADQLFKMWNTAFNLTPELLNLSLDAISEIDKHYFYINRLILDCQKVAVNISPTVWQEIEERMLRVP